MSKPKLLPPIERLDALFEIRNGILYNRISRAKAKAGKEAGTVNKISGYRFVCVDGTRYHVHRIVWAIANRADPGEAIVDHIDRDTLNNDPQNLRIIDKRLNALNSKTHSHNTSGIKGVSWRSRENKWVAIGRKFGKVVFLGGFADKNDAVKARQEWEQQQWPT